MKKRKEKPWYRKFRAPLPTQVGGAHQAAKGGKYRRSQEKEKTRKEIKVEFD